MTSKDCFGRRDNKHGEYRDALKRLYCTPENCAFDKMQIQQDTGGKECKISRMIEQLDLIDESNPKYEGMDLGEVSEEVCKAVDEFYKLLSELFWELRD